MKAKMRIGLIGSMVLLFAIPSFAQEMTKDQWAQNMTEARQNRDAVKREVDSLGGAVVQMKTDLATLNDQVGKCQDDLMAMLGTTKAEEEEFGKYLDGIDGHLNELSKLSDKDLFMRRAELDSVQSMIKNARSQKLSWLPEYAQRLQEEQYRLDTMKQSLKKLMSENEETYTVGTWAKNHDCLWNISKKRSVYDNAFLWPKIWEDNRDQIKNPDIIRPGEKLKIPSKSPLTAEDNTALQSYWRRKESFASAKHSTKESH